MALPVFPSFRYQGWPTKRTPAFDTLLQQASSGKEIRLAYYPYPIWHWELTFGGGDTGFLPDNPNKLFGTNLDTDLVTIQGFYLQMQGRLGVFLLDDPDDDVVSGQAIATGDGSTTVFQLIRTRGGYAEPVQTPFTAPAPNIYVDGVLKTVGTDYAISNPGGALTFTAAPALGKAITADINYYWPVRFDDDSQEYEKFMFQLWNLRTVKLIQVKL
jgi:uncharacterized protein (TIGR02217 family)